MKKTTLEITYIENGKPVIESKKGYTLTAKTSDGVEIELFAYKENTWFVIDPISTKCVSLGPTRYNVVISATEIVESISYNDFEKWGTKEDGEAQLEEDEDEQEELETVEKHYLNDLLEDVSFDTSDLDDNWMEDEAGFYTTDLYEVNWALKYKRGVEIEDEQNVDTSQFEHDDYIKLTQEEMDSQREEIERYLWNYRPTRSTEMDEKFAISKCDVASLAKDFRGNEVYVYSKMEYLEYLYELAYDADGQDREHFENLHDELMNRKFDVLVDRVSDYYYFV